VKSWNKKDLIGNEKDRRRLMAMTELERELELAERKKRVMRIHSARSIGRKNDIEKKIETEAISGLYWVETDR
jgi:hypothetical protein